MKRKILIPVAASATAILLMVACKKKDPETPVNKSGDTPCSFCFGDMLQLGSDNQIVATDYAQQTTFLKNGQDIGPSPISAKTPNGFYGYQGGVGIEFNSAQLPMSCTSNKITFVHARVTSSSNGIPALVNVRFPGTPLISTIPDSLDYYLNPYGYTVENYFGPGAVWTTQSGPATTGVVDSIIIRGPEFEVVRIGADLFESEIRSICVAHE